MGVSISKNTINSMINDSNSIISTYENLCSANGTSTQAQLNINGCTFVNTPINITANTFISQTCVQNNRSNNSLQSSVRQQMQQAAQAITQSFGFPSVSAAQNFINDSVTLGDQIVDYYYNTCTAQATQNSSVFNCTNSTFECTNNNPNCSAINVESYQEITQKCLQTNTTTNAIISKMEEDLNQTAVAMQQNTFASVLIFFLVIIVIIAYAGISVADSPLVQWGIVFLVAFSVISSAIYTITARNNGNYPYKK